jgi:hypothetical protein
LNYTYNETNMSMMPPSKGGNQYYTKIEGDVTMAKLDELLDKKTTAAEESFTEGDCPPGFDCSFEVVKQVVITVVHSFKVPCASLPVRALDYKYTYAAVMEVAISDVAIEIVSETGCRRLLANGERRLSEGTQEVSAAISYPGTAEGKWTAVAVVGLSPEFFETRLKLKLESEASVIATVTQSVEPEVGISVYVVASLSQAPTSSPTLAWEAPTPATAEPTTPATAEPTVQPTMATESPTLAPSNATEAPTNYTEEESRAALTGAGLVKVAVAAFSLISTAL